MNRNQRMYGQMMTIKPQTFEALLATVQSRVIYFNYLSNIEEDFNRGSDHTCDDDNILNSTHVPSVPQKIGFKQPPIKKKSNCSATFLVNSTENKDF
eukprot:Awhi_evm1s981